jgi:hypothetical protein
VPSTTWTVALCTRPATAVTSYSPGRTACRVPVQPGADVRRSQEKLRTAGLFLARTAAVEPPPFTQSAELQMRRLPWATTTDTNLVPVLKRHGWLSRDTARTVKRGVLPCWYQYCGDDRLSVTPPRAHRAVRPVAAARPEAREWVAVRCGDGVGSGRGEGEGGGSPRSVLATAGEEAAAPAPLGGTAWPAVERATSSPFTAQLKVVSKPTPTPMTTSRRRQYVAAETRDGRARPPPGWPALPRWFWSIPIEYES